METITHEKISSESSLLPTTVPSSSVILVSGPLVVTSPTTYLPDAPACKLFEDPWAWKDITFDAIEEFHKFYHGYAYEAGFIWRKMSTVSRRSKSDVVTRIRFARLGCQNEGYKDESALDPKNKGKVDTTPKGKVVPEFRCGRNAEINARWIEGIHK
ncbi:hypothetical protein LINPERPRIM_LOCUS20948 [Linum perenne]